MSNKLKIGIAIAAYNEEVHLPLLLDAILRQPGIESVVKIAVADSNSTDNSATIIKRFEEQNSTITYLLNTQRITPISMNMGFQECITAGADIIVNLVAHGSISSDFILKLQALAAAKKEVHIFNASLDFLPPESETEEAIQLFTLSRFGRNWKKYYNMKEAVDGPSSGIICVRREVVEKIGYFDEELIRNQDIDFVTRAIKAGFRVQTVPEIIYYYRTRQTVSSHYHQMYRTGLFVVKGAKNLKLKHKIPGIFYATMCFLLSVGLIGLITESTVFTMFGLWTFGMLLLLYAGGIFYEGMRMRKRSAVSLFHFMKIVIISHYAYGMGTLTGVIKKK